jgi:hypothetical protein
MNFELGTNVLFICLAPSFSTYSANYVLNIAVYISCFILPQVIEHFDIFIHNSFEDKYLN